VFAAITYNSLISYECNYGFTVVGDQVRRCERNKEWTGTEPHCKGNNFFDNPSGRYEFATPKHEDVLS